MPDPLLRLGFGFVEIGTVTPRPQAGNPRPRIFRLEADGAIINRLGFNNDGEAAVLARLRARSGAGVLGVNIGANRDSADRAADYVKLVETFAPVASYLTVNVSSPNTPGLRDLQQAKTLDDLLGRVLEARDRLAATAGRRPLLLKIAPDLSLNDLDDVVAIVRKRGIDGMIVGNTTLSRPASLQERVKSIEQGGLSGAPLFALSTRMLAETYVRAEGAFALIGAGGIDSGRGRARQDQGRRHAGAALFGTRVSRAVAARRDQARACRSARTREAGEPCAACRRRCRGADGDALAGVTISAVVPAFAGTTRKN